MALSDNGNGNGMIMPVSPLGYGGFGGGWNSGWGNGFGGDGWWVILFLFALMGNGGWGGFGGFGGGAWGADMLATLPYFYNTQTQNDVNRGFDNAGLNSQLSSIQTSLNTGFSNAEVANCNRAIDNLQTAYANQIADLNRSFDAQTAIGNQLDTLEMSLQKCCCDNQLATESLRYTVATENAADRAELSNGVRDIIASQTAGTQRILDKLCDQELQAERRENDQLRTQLNMANLAASQSAQTAQLIADNTAQTQYIVNRVAPYPIPAYPVNNPYGCGYGFGFNNGFNNFGNFGFNPFGNVGFGNGSF